MRLLAPVAAVAFVLCLLAPPVTAGEWGLDAMAKRPSPWKGHGIGSYITQTMTMEMPNMPSMPNVPGMPQGGKMVTTTKTTLVGITDTDYELKVETTRMGRTTTTQRTEPKVRTVDLQGKVEDVGEGSVTIEGQSYPCKIKSVKDMTGILGGAMPHGRKGHMGAASMGSGKVWVHPTLGLLRSEVQMTVMGSTHTMTWVVTKLKASHTIGTQTYTGREMTTEMDFGMGKSTTTMIVSPSVPGGALEMVVKTNAMGHETTMKREITAYVKKPLTATTPGDK
jgi:hypothetical protein